MKVNWIPMDVKQPSKPGQYLVTHYSKGDKEYTIDIDDWDDLGEFWELCGDSVTAWAELPEPYREAQNG